MEINLKFKREHLVCVNERKLRALSCGKKQCSAMSTQGDRVFSAITVPVQCGFGLADVSNGQGGCKMCV